MSLLNKITEEKNAAALEALAKEVEKSIKEATVDNSYAKGISEFLEKNKDLKSIGACIDEFQKDVALKMFKKAFETSPNIDANITLFKDNVFKDILNKKAEEPADGQNLEHIKDTIKKSVL